MQFIQTRLKFIVGFMGVIILLATCIVYSKFGFGILEDNFVARLYTDYASVTHFLAFYALLNLYVYLMIYAYRFISNPSCGGLFRTFRMQFLMDLIKSVQMTLA